MMNQEIDVTGEICPRPALIVRDNLEEMEPGESLLVTADYPPARDNIERTCQKHGYETAEAESGEGDLFTLRIVVPDEAKGPVMDS
jgi:tRNA 2-thiouridine synthesizing protein A